MAIQKRQSDAEDQISTARQMPRTWESGTGADQSADTEQVKAAEVPTESHDGAPPKLPGYGK